MPIDNPGIISAYLFTKVETRDLAAASGNVSYTGYGFQPSALIICGRIGAQGSIGISEPGLTEQGVCVVLTLDGEFNADIANFYPTLNNRVTAVVLTYDPDGFTLTWTKLGVPTGIATLIVIALKGA